MSRPRDLLEAMGRRPSALRGAAPVLVCAAAWAHLCLALAADGRVPSGPAPGIPREAHYLWQAALIAPILLTSWQIFGRVSRALAARSGGAADRAVLEAAGWSLGGAFLVVWVLPDRALYAWGGFEAMAAWLPLYAPATVAAAIGAQAAALRALCALPLGGAIRCAGIGFVAAMLPILAVVR